jgi:hypothetical protein
MSQQLTPEQERILRFYQSPSETSTPADAIGILGLEDEETIIDHERIFGPGEPDPNPTLIHRITVEKYGLWHAWNAGDMEAVLPDLNLSPTDPLALRMRRELVAVPLPAWIVAAIDAQAGGPEKRGEWIAELVQSVEDTYLSEPERRMAERACPGYTAAVYYPDETEPAS